MTHATHAGNFGFSFEAAIAAADLDAEIAVYTADLASEAARPDFIVYSRVRGGFVYGPESGVYASNTAADIARSGPPTPTPMPGPGDFDESDSALCAAPVSTAVCNGCGRPADERCYECEWPLCAGCKDRWHRHGLPVSARRNGAAFFDRQRVAAAFRTSTIETYVFNARAAAAELHGDLGDAAYSERVQAEADALFN